MGIESANYTITLKDGLERVPEVLAQLGGLQRHGVRNDFQTWIFEDDHYWIDVMTGSFGPNSSLAISVRVALCNPVDVEMRLRQLLTDLLGHFGGRLYDSQTSRSYTKVDDPAWTDIYGGFAAKRAQFRQHFGSFEAAISGERVFDVIRERQKKTT